MFIAKEFSYTLEMRGYTEILFENLNTELLSLTSIFIYIEVIFLHKPISVPLILILSLLGNKEKLLKCICMESLLNSLVTEQNFI